MPYSKLLLLTFVAGCSFPQHVAKKTAEDVLPASGIRQLDCTSHNGDITVHGKPGSSEIRMRVEMSVRGYTAEEAVANLDLLTTYGEIDGERLVLKGEYDRSASRMSPSFTFILEVPPELVNKLESHNGDIRVFATGAALDCYTHNGDIEANGRASEVKCVSHNGDLRLDLDGEGPIDGSLATHNGDVIVTLGEGLSTSLRASTHNGRIRVGKIAANPTHSKRELTCRFGSGAGRLEIETHNGNVEIR